MRVTDAASQLGVSPRRVRAMAAQGRVPAHKEGAVWVIEELVNRKTRRALSVNSWQNLSRSLKQRSLAGLSGQERARTAARIKALRTAPHPSSLLIDWRPAQAPADVFLDSLVAYAERNDDYYLKHAMERPEEYLRSSQDLAEIVSSERAIRGMSRSQLASAAAVSARFVRDIESALPLVSPGQVRRVLGALGIEATALPDMALT